MAQPDKGCAFVVRIDVEYKPGTSLQGRVNLDFVEVEFELSVVGKFHLVELNMLETIQAA